MPGESSSSKATGRFPSQHQCFFSLIASFLLIFILTSHLLSSLVKIEGGDDESLLSERHVPLHCPNLFRRILCSNSYRISSHLSRKNGNWCQVYLTKYIYFLTEFINGCFAIIPIVGLSPKMTVIYKPEKRSCSSCLKLKFCVSVVIMTFLYFPSTM